MSRTRSRTRSCAAASAMDAVEVARRSPLMVVLARREGDGEADQLQSVEDAIADVQLGIGEFAGRVAFVVRNDRDVS